MEHTIVSIVEALILPPGLFLVLLGIGILILRRKPLIGRTLVLSGIALCYLLSTPIVAGLLIERVEIYPALETADLEAGDAQAIVVLSSGWEKNAAEYDNDTVGPHTLIRCRYGAYLHARTGLPILASGGIPAIGKTSLAQMMADVLSGEFGTGEVWIEDRSGTTYENAQFSARLLREKQIDTIFLVTEAWHMARAVPVFEDTGLRVIPAPTAFRGAAASGEAVDFLAWLPSANALGRSYAALHEIVGMLWYRIRY
jgi:uncharacterized SAM-binding protein YcdF (DUF218 family)